VGIFYIVTLRHGAYQPGWSIRGAGFNSWISW